MNAPTSEPGLRAQRAYNQPRALPFAGLASYWDIKGRALHAVESIRRRVSRQCDGRARGAGSLIPSGNITFSGRNRPAARQGTPAAFSVTFET